MSDILKAVLVLIFLLVLLLVPNIRIIQPNKAYIIERLGRFYKLIDQPGFYFTVPIIDRVLQVVSLEESKFNTSFFSNENGTHFDMTITYKITDPKLFAYAALDSIGNFKAYIAESMQDAERLDKEHELMISEAAVSYGIEVIEICDK